MVRIHSIEKEFYVVRQVIVELVNLSIFRLGSDLILPWAAEGFQTEPRIRTPLIMVITA